MGLLKIINENFPVSAELKKDLDNKGQTKPEIGAKDQSTHNQKHVLEDLYKQPTKTFKPDDTYSNVLVPKIIKSYSPSYEPEDDIMTMTLRKLKKDERLYPVKGYISNGKLHVTHYADILIIPYAFDLSTIDYVEVEDEKKYYSMPWDQFEKAKFEGTSEKILKKRIKYLKRDMDFDYDEVEMRLERLSIPNLGRY